MMDEKQLEHLRLELQDKESQLKQERAISQTYREMTLVQKEDLTTFNIEMATIDVEPTKNQKEEENEKHIEELTHRQTEAKRAIEENQQLLKQKEEEAYQIILQNTRLQQQLDQVKVDAETAQKQKEDEYSRKIEEQITKTNLELEMIKKQQEEEQKAKEVKKKLKEIKKQELTIKLQQSSAVINLDIVPSPTFLQNHWEAKSVHYRSSLNKIIEGSPEFRRGMQRAISLHGWGSESPRNDKMSVQTPERFRASHQDSQINEFTNRINEMS